MSQESDRPLCACGCGEPVKLAKQDYPKRGLEKGDPFTYRRGHHLRGENHHSWSGGRTESGGYIRVLVEGDHPRADVNGYVYEHVLIAEAAICGPLPEEAEVHHVNGDGTDNSPGNLVICEDHEYHMLLEKRKKALDACGHADWLKCYICKEWAPLDDLSPNRREAKKHYHPDCHRQYQRRMRRKRQEGGAR